MTSSVAKLGLCELADRISSLHTELLIVEHSFKQTAYVKRQEGDEVALLTDIVRSDAAREFKHLESKLQSIPRDKKKRLTRLLSKEEETSQLPVSKGSSPGLRKNKPKLSSGKLLCSTFE